VDDPPIREWLVTNGYAWAASSFSGNDLDVAVGVKDTHTLTQRFNGLVALPAHVYLSGMSMGGAITVNTIEQYPDVYDGAMPVCSSLATYENLDYLLDYYALSNALAGMDAVFPIPSDYSTTIYPEVKSKLELIPGTYPFTLNAQGQHLKDALEIITGGERPIYDQGFLFWYGALGNFVIDFGTLGPDDPIGVPGATGNFIDNMDVIYQFDSDPALTAEEQALNEVILRVASDPMARKPNGLKNMPIAEGKITIPVLTMHDLGDLFVPFFLEQIYARKVAAQGASELLVQRAYRDVLHCSFTPDEMATSFVDLVNWVENGVKPAGDDILNPAAVADPDFGCQFTSVDRIYPAPMEIPACP
jgi:pimeloyl-ACP methyl ester carboxylesterase